MRAGLVTGALLLLIPTAAAAQDPDYAYHYDPAGDSGLPMFAGLRGSLAFNGRTSTTVPTAPPTALRASYNTGGGGSVYIGMRLPYGFRAEAEGMFRYLPVSNVLVGGTQSAASGQARMGALMGNVFYDLPVPDFIFRPFLGAGLGSAYVADSAVAGGNTYLQQSNFHFAYQFMGGAEVPLSQSSRFTAMYRWMDIGGVRGKCGVSGAPTLLCRSDLNSQSIDLGLEMDM